MKQIINRLFFTALAAVLMASGLSSCTSEPWGNPDLSSAISLSANVQATTHTKAAVSGTTFPASTGDVFRLTAFSGAAAPTTDWSAAPYFNDIQVNSGAASALTFATAQYYPANGDKVYFYGYAPATASLTDGTASTAPTANYTITGQEDIMAAQADAGFTTAANTGMHLAFTHKLMQVRFNIVKDASYDTGKKVTEVLVKDVKTSAKLNIATGVLTFDGTADNLSLPIVAGTNEITAEGTEMDGCVMLEPVGTGGSIMLKVTADGVVYDNIKVTITGTNDGTAGTSHLITLTFKRGEITSSATITDWATPVDKDVDVDDEGLTSLPPAVGDFKDGGIVYEVTDATKYKVMSLDEGSDLVWSAQNSYAIGANAQSDTDGKANSAAIKNYFAANAATVGLDFSVAFPAANFCDKKNTGGVTGWYLPAKDELKALYTAYTAHKPAIDAGLGSNGTAITANGYFWSSTENSSRTTFAWCVKFSDSNAISNGKRDKSLVRCVRDITPPPPPAVGDYYYSDGSYSTDLDAKKTATGMVYYLDPDDPKKYKVMALEEATSKLAWAANNGYGVNGARSNTDGKANSAAIKAAFEAGSVDGTITENDFAVAFPAAAYCYNYKGKAGTDAEGSWHLPAKSELQYLWCSYNGVTPISWAQQGAVGIPPVDSVAQDSWNIRVKAGGGTAEITKENFWSSTENSYSGYAWMVLFSNGSTTNGSKSNTYYVRCVRDL